MNLMIALSCLLLAGPAWSQTEMSVPTISVYGTPKSSALESVPTVSEISGQKLQRKKQSTIGETLSHETGVSSTFFGPNASRPVIRGQEGDRVRILQNGTGVLDASAASQDHAVALDPFSIERIEVVRGAAALLYGSNAVGGAVNISTNRIPEKVPEKFNGKAEARGSSHDLGRGGAVSLNSPAGSRIAVHVDGAARAAEDYRSYDNSRVFNSYNRSANEAAGVSYVGDRGFIGTSFSNYESTYGTVAEQFVHINMSQQRHDVEGEVRDWAGLKSVRGKVSSSSYKHDEMEEEGLGTTFKNQGHEGRLEFRHPAVLGFSGLAGLQANVFDFSAKGEETFLPGTHNEHQAIFLFEEREQGRFRPSFGVRAESVAIKSKDDSTFGMGEKKTFSNYSGALGFLQQITQHYSVVLNGSLTQRAPNYEELFAGGPHVATGIFEVGDKSLNKEKSQALELSLRHQGALGQGSVGLFVQDYHDYIALAPTGAVDPGSNLPIYTYTSAEARFYGAELEYRHNISHLLNSGTLELELKVDWLKGKNRDTGGHLPRVTPMRETIALIRKTDKFQTDIELQRVERQRDTAPNERSTGDYLLVNCGVERPVTWEGTTISLFARANNIFDAEARNHVSVSVIKDLAPLPGRNFVAGVQATF